MRNIKLPVPVWKWLAHCRRIWTMRNIKSKAFIDIIKDLACRIWTMRNIKEGYYIVKFIEERVGFGQ